MSGSRFWTVGQCLHWIVFRTPPGDDEQITHIRLCLRYGAGLAPATMGPNEALDELQAALEEGRLSASGQCSTIARGMIGDRRQIEPTRGYVPEVFWQGAQIDRDRMDSAIDATGERWTALLCSRAIITALWPAEPAIEAPLMLPPPETSGQQAAGEPAGDIPSRAVDQAQQHLASEDATPTSRRGPPLSPITTAAQSLFIQHPRPDGMARGGAKAYYAEIARMLQAAGHGEIKDDSVRKLYERFLNRVAAGSCIADTSGHLEGP